MERQGDAKMETANLAVDRKEALALYRKYKEHKAYSEPVDWEIQRTYQLLAQGKTVLRAIESIKLAGLNEKGLPKLALGPATAQAAHIRRLRDGSLLMAPNNDWWRNERRRLNFAQESFAFPEESFPTYVHDGKRYRHDRSEHRAMTPIVPIHLRPKRGLENYHVLWEAEWERVVPKDPYLLRRIGKGDLWLVVAHWDLTEVERAALATRIPV
jgi:hypothetical protein